MKLNLKFVSVVLGIMVWIYVNLIISPVLRRTVKARIESQNRPPLTRITSAAEEAEVVLTGTRREFILAGKEPAKITIDLNDRRPGKLQVPVKVYTHSGLSVISLRPPQVNVTLENLLRREMTVEPEIRGQPAEGYIAEPPRLLPQRVIVEGPAELVKNLSKCKVLIDLTELKNSISEGRQVHVQSGFGELDSQISVFPEKVNVDVAVKKGYPEKEVPVASPTFLNKPPEGWRLERFSMDPSRVVVSGPQRILDQVKEVPLVGVNLATLQASSSVIALFELPYESLRVVGSPTVSLTFSLTPVKVLRRFAPLQLTVMKSPNQNCRVSISSYSLLLSGYVDDLNRVMPADLGIVLDTREMEPGSYSFGLQAPKGIPGNIAIQEIFPPQVQVELSEISETPLPSGTPTLPSNEG